MAKPFSSLCLNIFGSCVHMIIVDSAPDSKSQIGSAQKAEAAPKKYGRDIVAMKNTVFLNSDRGRANLIFPKAVI